MGLKIGDCVDAYEVVRVIGTGAVGQVFQVRHTITGRFEAMKVLLRSSSENEELAKRFLREIRVHASLSHPNIVAVHNALWAGDDLVMVMEYVEGESLETRLTRKRLRLMVGLDLMVQSLAGLTYAHARGVTHRDISPANMLVTKDDHLKIMDFGLAVRPAEVRMSQTGGPVGSLPYMSPEQVRGSTEADPRSDIYSIGAVLYEVITGRKPFLSQNVFELMRAQVEDIPVPPSQLNVQLPMSLDEIIQKAMAKNPASRFASAQEFLDALHALQVHLNPAAKPLPRQAAWSAKLPLRKIGIAAAITGIVLLTAVAAIVSQLPGDTPAQQTSAPARQEQPAVAATAPSEAPPPAPAPEPTPAPPPPNDSTPSSPAAGGVKKGGLGPPVFPTLAEVRTARRQAAELKAQRAKIREAQPPSQIVVRIHNLDDVPRVTPTLPPPPATTTPSTQAPITPSLPPSVAAATQAQPSAPAASGAGEQEAKDGKKRRWFSRALDRVKPRRRDEPSPPPPK